jgi:hypothetical protein
MALMDPLNVVLVACPQEFDAPMTTVPGNVRYVGAILDNPPPRLENRELPQRRRHTLSRGADRDQAAAAPRGDRRHKRPS